MTKKIFLLFYLLISMAYSQSFSDIMDQRPLWTGSFGTVTIDGETYNQISLRPEFNFGNWGVGFDVYLYIDGDGNIYEESWNFSDLKSSYQTIVDKLK